MEKIKTRSEFCKKFRGVYEWLRRNNKLHLLDNILCKSHMDKYKNWQEIVNFSKKHGRRPYRNPKDRHERRLANNLYNYMRHNTCPSWYLEKYSRKIRKPYTKNECLDIAKQYNSRTQWERESPSSQNRAKKMGWYEECCRHMRLYQGLFVKNLDTGEVFSSLNKAIKSTNRKGQGSLITEAIRRNGKAGGYRWAYCDEDGNIIE